MIWVDGTIVADDALGVRVLDRSLEHGLGLFETLRTWNGRAPLLGRHLERLRRSAGALGIALDPASLPDQRAIQMLLAQEGRPEDRMIRVQLAGGRDAATPAPLWMRAHPLPAPTPAAGVSVLVGAWRIEPSDELARHKTLNYWTRRRAFEHARERGRDETLATGVSDGRLGVWEGSRTNLFVVRDGCLITPALGGPLVPGIMRELVLELARERELEASRVDVLGIEALLEAHEVFLTNSVRGIIPVRCVERTDAEPIDIRSREAPGPRTRQLQEALDEWLRVTTREEAG